MGRSTTPKIEATVARAADALLVKDGRISYPALFREIGMLPPASLREWNAGRVDYLERIVHGSLSKLSRIQGAMRAFARERNLRWRWQGAPHGRRYSKSGLDALEHEYGRVYVPVSDGQDTVKA